MDAASGLERTRLREYETIFILDPRIAAEQAERVVGRLNEVMEGRGGRLVKVDYWGKRKLSYRIRRTDWGFYYYVRYVGAGDVVAELERSFRMMDAVMRYQTIVLREDVDTAAFQSVPGDVEFHLDLLARDAAEPIREGPRDETLASAETAAAESESETEGEIEAGTEAEGPETEREGEVEAGTEAEGPETEREAEVEAGTEAEAEVGGRDAATEEAAAATTTRQTQPRPEEAGQVAKPDGGPIRRPPAPAEAVEPLVIEMTDDEDDFGEVAPGAASTSDETKGEG